MGDQSNNDSAELHQVRQRIDQVDAQLQALIEERAKCAQQIATIKRAAGDAHFYRPEREAQVLRGVLARVAPDHILAGESVGRIFREIMSACLAVEQPLRVAFLGPEGTFSQEAALKHFGHGVNAQPQLSVADVFREVETGRCQYGVVPVENSTEGSVTFTLDIFIASHAKICGEVELRIRLHLLSKGQKLDSIKRVYGHQQALAQCRSWLETHLRGIEQIPVSSNGEAAQRAAAQPDAAAVASESAAEIYGLNCLAVDVEDSATNTTRFFVVSNHYPGPSGQDKTSLLLTTGNQPGALYRMLAPFANNGISMSRIQSRPSQRGNWDYVFFVDIEGHVADATVAKAVQDLGRVAAMVKILGAYPCAVI